LNRCAIHHWTGVLLFGGLIAGNIPALAQFETRTTFPVLPSPVSIATGDFNRDGKLDLVVASMLDTTQVTVLLGNGDGTFQPGVNYTTGSAPYSVVVADFNSDGNADIAAANYLDGTVSVLLGNGDGTFQAAVNYSTPPGPTFVGVGSFKGNRTPSLIVLESTDACRCVSVLLSNGDGTFQEPPINTSLPFPYAVSIAAGHFGGEELDVATAGWFESSSAINILLGSGSGTFSTGANYPGLFPDLIIAADLRGSGVVDIVAANDQSGGNVLVFLGIGDGTFQPPVAYPAAWPASLAAADFNGDGKIDLVVADESPPLSAVSILLGNGDGTFQPATEYPVGYESSYAVAGDFNNDHEIDLAGADPRDNDVTVLLNTGAVRFSPTTPLNFKKQAVGTTSPAQKVTLTNTGKTALKISSMKASSQFGVTSTCGKSVSAGANCIISVTFSPESKGAKSGTVTINDSASSKPMVIELSGTGS
jgi:hypothetical protein